MGRGHILGGRAYIAYATQNHGHLYRTRLARMYDANTAIIDCHICNMHTHDAHAAQAHNARAALIPTKSAPPKNFT